MCCIAKFSIDVAPTPGSFLYNDMKHCLSRGDKENQTTFIKKSDKTLNALTSLLIQYFTKLSLYTLLLLRTCYAWNVDFMRNDELKREPVN